METEISNLEEQETYFKKQVNSAPTDEAKKNTMNELRKTRIQLESKRTELIEKKGVNTVFDPMLGFLSQHPPSCSIRVWTDNQKPLKVVPKLFLLPDQMFHSVRYSICGTTRGTTILQPALEQRLFL